LRWPPLPVISAPVPPPDWLPKLAEALAGQRIDENGVREVVSVEALFQFRQKLRQQWFGLFQPLVGLVPC